MKHNVWRRICSAALVLVMLLALLPLNLLQTRANAEEGTYVLDTTADLQACSQGAKADGETEVVNNFFTIYYSAKSKVDNSKKTFIDEYSATQRLSFGGKTSIKADGVKNAIAFTTTGPATVKIWWVQGGEPGDTRQVGIYDLEGNIVTQSNVADGEYAKNDPVLSTLELTEAGTYYIGNVVNQNPLFKIEVTLKPAAPTVIVNTLDTTADLQACSQGAKADGETEVVNGYFTIYYSAKSKVDNSKKTFIDEYSATQRLSFGGKTSITADGVKNAIAFTTTGPATVKIWWVQGGEPGDTRQVGIYDLEGNIVTQSNVADGEYAKNDPVLSTLELTEAGTYYIGNVVNQNPLFKIEVTETSNGPVEVVRKPWSEVAAPVINGANEDGEGNIIVDVTATVGPDGADELQVVMYDAQGVELAIRRTIAEKDVHSLSFTPSDSGDYTFKAFILREEEQPKFAEADLTAPFKLILGKSNIISVTNKGAGDVEVVWTAVKEAVSYELYADDTYMGTTSETSFIAENLQIGQKYAFTVVAVRGEDRSTSAAVSATVIEEAQQTWGFTFYGPSTSASGNGYTGSLNEDGKVTVFSTGGKGKIQPTDGDGLAFYYTAVPTTHNFTLRAKVTVDSWTFSNGQEGFGLMAADKLGVSGDAKAFYNNSYLVGCTKIEYRSEGEKIYDAAKYTGGTKYSMKLGLGTIARTGVSAETMDLFLAGDSNTINNYSTTLTLESAASYWEMEKGTYNIVGNFTKDPGGSIEGELKTSFILEIQKNNTGYFITYYAEDGTVLNQQKFYGPEDLNQLDSEYVYVGFFAARNATATFSDVDFSTILCSEDAPAEEIPVNEIEPTVRISSCRVDAETVTTKQDFELLVDTNVSGTISVQVAYETVLENVAITGGQRLSVTIPMKNYGKNDLKVIFTPDPNQYLGENTVLSTTDSKVASTNVYWNKGNYHTKVIFVAPDGLPTGNGTKEYPYDLYTAVDNVVPGQVIVLMEGTYLMLSSLQIERGMDGTAENPIYMIADPEAASRPVLDFQRLYSGFTTAGDYWYFKGFDVTNSLAGEKGFQISGSHNVIDSVNAYNNGNSGIQISRLLGTDQYDYWPAYNLILNCTSYGNCDPGYEDADGFAVKLTAGPGNVLDGCVAYLNADDGYDLYAKNETGAIGVVTIRNSVAYANGYVFEDGKYINAGNGNGFKLGGSNITGYHVLENCYAFYNKSKGIDSNSCPDIQVYDCVSYNNGSYNVAFYTKIDTKSTDFFATGIVSFRNAMDKIFAGEETEEQLDLQGTQDRSKVYGSSNYYWIEGECVNDNGAEVTADMFVSLEFTGFTRNADGSINLNGFLQRNEKMPADAGVDYSKFTPSGGLTALPEDLEHTFADSFTFVDNLSHWRECECGAKTDLGAHVLEWIIDQEATPEADGKKHQECATCGYKAPAVTIYYQAPAPEVTEPATTVPATTGSSDIGGNDSGSNIVLIVVIVLAVLAAGAFVVCKFLIKKKEN